MKDVKERFVDLTVGFSFMFREFSYWIELLILFL
jgi:hypothetical protein